MLNSHDIKKDFPILSRKVSGKELVYLDNAATSQKPSQVINLIKDYYETHNANVHRGLHTLSDEASDMYEAAREKVAKFIGAVKTKEVVFTSGTTESLNLVAFGWAIQNLTKGDEILMTMTEHHSNLVPWQRVSKHTGCSLNVLDLYQAENDDVEKLIKENIKPNTKLVALTHASNVTGEILPVKEISKAAHKVGALVCVDGAQAAPHFKINMQSLDCDFYAFSAHKMLGPTGVGVLWARQEILENMDPYKFGGGMIDEVEPNDSTWAKVPEKFEGGTPNIAGVIGFSAAVDYLSKIGLDNVRAHEIELNKFADETLNKIDGMQLVSHQNPENRTGVITFSVTGAHAHDIAAILNTEGIAVRSGHHCAMPLHNKLGLAASVRASYYLYNTKEDIDKLAGGIEKAIKILK